MMKNAEGTFAEEIGERKCLPQSTGSGVFCDDKRVALDTRGHDAGEPAHLAIAHADSFVVLVGQIGKTPNFGHVFAAQGRGVPTTSTRTGCAGDCGPYEAELPAPDSREHWVAVGFAHDVFGEVAVDLEGLRCRPRSA